MDRAVQCVVTDIRSLRLTEGDGHFDMATSYIVIGVAFGELPDDDAIKKIIPSRKVVTKQVGVKQEKEDATLIRHLNRLIEPTYGEITIDEVNVLKLNNKELLEYRQKNLQVFILFRYNIKWR